MRKGQPGMLPSKQLGGPADSRLLMITVTRLPGIPVAASTTHSELQNALEKFNWVMNCVHSSCEEFLELGCLGLDPNYTPH